MEHATPRWSCCVCSGELLDARLLPCLHSICGQCRAAGAGKNKDGSLRCGTCSYVVAPRLLDTLQVDYMALDYLALQKLRDPRKSNNCDECVDGEVASHRCVSCCQFLCTLHHNSHKKSKATHDHQTIPLTQLQSSASAGAAIAGSGHVDVAELAVARSALLCARHTQKELELYCASCSECICRDCIVVDHKSHDFTFISDAIKKNKNRQDILKLDKMVEQFEGTLSRIERSQETLTNNFHTTSQDMERAASEVKHLVDTRLKELLSDVDKVYQGKSIALENQKIALTTLQEKVVYASVFAKSIMECGSPSQQLILKSVVDSRLKSLVQDCKEKSILAHDDGSLSAVLDLSDLKEAVGEFGRVTSTAASGTSSLGLPAKCYSGLPVTVTVDLADASGHPTSNICESTISCSVAAPGGEDLDIGRPTIVSSMAVFKFIPKYVSRLGDYSVSATISGQPVLRSPAIANVILPPWKFEHVCKSKSLRMVGSVRDTGVQLSSTGMYAKLEDERPTDMDQRRGFDRLNSSQNYFGYGLWPSRLIAGSEAIATAAGPVIEWHITLEQYGVLAGTATQDQSVGVGILVNLPVSSVKKEVGDVAQAYVQSSVALFSTGKVFVRQHQCQDQRAGGDRAQNAAAFTFHSCDTLKLVYVADSDYLVVTQRNCDVKCVVDLRLPAKKILPLDDDLEAAFGTARAQQGLNGRRGHYVADRRGGMHAYAPRSAVFGEIASILPAVWLSAEFTGNALLSFPID
ncbi:E3 ubiquitin-protein ligase TRIM71-like [Sycon ciliatum]|uniref:E3 ubiquitin-protein ligase TRIM71-like n=1 Tax=Sycon ciliatum TaxID=27933 RepID=UPI0020A9A055